MRAMTGVVVRNSWNSVASVRERCAAETASCYRRDWQDDPPVPRGPGTCRLLGRHASFDTVPHGRRRRRATSRKEVANRVSVTAGIDMRARGSGSDSVKGSARRPRSSACSRADTGAWMLTSPTRRRQQSGRRSQRLQPVRRARDLRRRVLADAAITLMLHVEANGRGSVVATFAPVTMAPRFRRRRSLTAEPMQTSVNVGPDVASCLRSLLNRERARQRPAPRTYRDMPGQPNDGVSGYAIQDDHRLRVGPGRLAHVLERLRRRSRIATAGRITETPASTLVRHARIYAGM